MPLVNVAIVAVDGFSPFHYSVPCILFGDTVSGEKRFNVTICAEKPGFLTSKDGFALHATQDFSAIASAEIVVVPYWQHVLERPPQTLLDSPFRPETTGRKLLGCVWDRLYWAMRAYSAANGPPPTGSLNTSFRRCFRTFDWTSTRSTWTTAM